nr:MAG TPA: hypothetical protein [Caudoviricetes sp.]
MFIIHIHIKKSHTLKNEAAQTLDFTGFARLLGYFLFKIKNVT